ncbi:MAG: hypothetical protein LUF29_05725 [Oscillospiraceae bacterium]|nr:hypothetical protein [Oscillospiraceae bacterium]
MAKSSNNKKSCGENVHKGHRQRLKQQFLDYGLDRFYDHQALELLLFFSIPQCDTNPTAHALLNRFESIPGVLNADYNDLLEVDGVGDSTACLLKLLPAFFTKYLLSGLDGERLDTTPALCRYFLYRLATVQNEQLWVVCLDDKLSAVSTVKISEGDGSSVCFNAYKIVSEVVKSKCTSCAIAHNHPFCDTEPSDEDIRFTEALRTLLESAGIDFVDHIIVSRTEARSMLHNEIVVLEDDIKAQVK